MTLADMVQEVIIMTNRPDQTARITSNVKKATLKLHASDWYPKDLVTVAPVAVLPVIATDTRYYIDTSANVLLPRIREIKAIKEYSATPNGTEILFARKDIEELADQYGREAVNYWSLAGAGVNIRAARAMTNLAITYYQYPDISDSSFKSWIATELPYCIIDEAAFSTFKAIGKDDEAATYKLVFPENLAMIRSSSGIAGAQ